MARHDDIHTRITNKIVADLEQGTRPWMKPWNGGTVRITRPLRHTGEAYAGINVVVLWAEAFARGYVSPTWMTYRQASELGGQVRRGEKGTHVVYAGRITKTETTDAGEETEREIPFLKAYTVFNCGQIDGLPERFHDTPEPVIDPAARIERAEAFFAATGADIVNRGNRALYALQADRISMPPFELFHDAESYYATLGHEAVQNAEPRIMPGMARGSIGNPVSSRLQVGII